MGLGSLFCGVSAERRRSRAASRAALVAAAAAPPKESLKPGAKEVVARQKDWMRTEGMTLRRGEEKRAEAKFSALMDTYRGARSPLKGPSGRELQRGSVMLGHGPLEDIPGVPPPPPPLQEEGMTRAQLQTFFAGMGMVMDAELFDMLFKLFDADNDGKVNKDEFSVAFGFLMYRGSAKDNVEMAFRIFDTNRDDKLSRREFAEMVCSIVGSRLSNLFKIEGGREAFQAHLDKEHSAEHLAFLDETDYMLRAERRARAGSRHRGRGSSDDVKVSRDAAERIFSEFLEVGAPRQVNVAAAMREACRAAIFTDWRGDLSMADTFDNVAAEVLYLLETDALDRFKLSMREHPGVLADDAWADLDLAPGESMTLEHFRTWAESHPGLFDIFDELSMMLESTSQELEAGAEKQRERQKKKEARRRMKELRVAQGGEDGEYDDE